MARSVDPSEFLPTLVALAKMDLMVVRDDIASLERPWTPAARARS